MASLPLMSFDSLALTVCIIWAVTIATLDLITFRIHNSSLLMGLFLVWPALFFIGQSFTLSLAVLTFTLLVSAAGLISLIGMGDVKLLLFAAPWLHFDNVRNPLILLIVLSWLQLMAVLVLKRSFPQRIAFAPAILAALALNMAT
jgi:Flp pilus assembly protein protease CpaA